jgi:hypothetical protein
MASAPFGGRNVKGIVFNTFYSYIEKQHDDVMLDDVIVAADLPHGGAYTSVGTYPFEEMLSLVGAYMKATSCPAGAVLDGFGQHCFASWVNYVPGFFAGHRHLFDILEQINDFHEREVRKLYPDAELPTFTTEARDARRLVIGYHSGKQLSDLAIGVIKGAATHLGVDIAVSAEPAEDAAGPYTRLSIQMLAPAARTEGGATCPMTTPS